MTSSRSNGDSKIVAPYDRAARSPKCSVRRGLAEAGRLLSGSDTNLARQLRRHNTPHDMHALDGCRGRTCSCQGERVPP